MHPAVQYIHDHAAQLRAEAAPSDELGRITARTEEILRESGGISAGLLCDADHGCSHCTQDSAVLAFRHLPFAPRPV